MSARGTLEAMRIRMRFPGIFAIALLAGAALAARASADSLFVDASNPNAGDGSSRNPFQKIAGDATQPGAIDTARARYLAGTSRGTTVIHVRRGTYSVPQ